LFSAGFSATRVSEILEYRAQLTCIAVATDPRVPLAQVLDSVESGPSSLTPHAAGYARLFDDWLAVLDEVVRRDEKSFSKIDRGHTLAHQIHKLSAEDVRRVALILAKTQGLKD
jgi:hypothetical protein